MNFSSAIVNAYPATQVKTEEKKQTTKWDNVVTEWSGEKVVIDREGPNVSISSAAPAVKADLGDDYITQLLFNGSIS